MLQRMHELVEAPCQNGWRLHLALPESENSIAATTESRGHPTVTLDVLFELRGPKPCVGLGGGRLDASRMSMPETTVNENYPELRAVGQIRRAREIGVSDSVA